MPDKASFFRDPVHGFIEVYDSEELILNTKAFQRLRRIRQLALTNYVYHGAEHTRFGHSLGVMHCANRIFESVFRNSSEALQAIGGRYERTRHLLRLFALLHDTGHGPFSHASDEFFPKGTSHESMSARIVRETEIGHLINEHYASLEITADQLADLIIPSDPDPWSIFIRTIMNSDVDADKMDYLLRDSLYCGVSYGKFDVERLVQSYTAYYDPEAGWKLGIKAGGLQALESFILARYWMFVQVYFNAKRRFWDLALQNFVKDSGSILQLDPLSAYLANDDNWLWHRIDEAAYAAAAGKEWAEAIVNRTHWADVDCFAEAQVSDADMVRFKYVQREVNRLFPEVIFDFPKKAPHKFHRADDEENQVAIIFEGKPRGVESLSDIVKGLSQPIRTVRAYMPYGKREAVRESIRKEWAYGEGD